jgi:hypothetical protein
MMQNADLIRMIELK